jgi:hypothetical protein
MNITCPSASAHFAPATIKANPAAFNMISTEMSIKIMLRLISTLMRPSMKSMPASINPDSIGILFMLFVSRIS